MVKDEKAKLTKLISLTFGALRQVRALLDRALAYREFQAFLAGDFARHSCCDIMNFASQLAMCQIQHDTVSMIQQSIYLHLALPRLPSQQSHHISSPVPSRTISHNHNTITIQSQYNHNTITIQSQYNHNTITTITCTHIQSHTRFGMV